MTTWQLIKLCIRHHCKPEGNYIMNRHRMLWFTFKAIVCILLKRPEVAGYDTITVAAWNGRYYLSFDCPNAYEWDELLVAYDKWQWSLSHDSNC